MQMVKVKVALYIRARDEQKLKALTDGYTEIVTSNGRFEIAGVYADIGMSGLNYNRDGLNELLKDAEKGEFALVFTPSMNHLGRNMVRTIETVETLKNCGVCVNFSRENVFTGKTEGKLMMAIMDAVSRIEEEV